ncbi:MAG: thioredoxin family protein [Pirellulales bacterium]
MQRISTLICLAVAVLMTSDYVRAEGEIRWQTDLLAARRLSQQYGVPVLIHFYGDHCLPCKTLEQNVFSKPEVAQAVQTYFVPVIINATQDRKTAADYNVHSWPTDVFLAPDGKTLSQGVCSQKPAEYLQNLQNVAVMNRDRSVMLAAQGSRGTPAVSSQPSGPQAPNGTYAPTGSSLPGSQQPYGRLTSASMQDSAPGRDGSQSAPSPYTQNTQYGANSTVGTPGATPNLSAATTTSLADPIANSQSASHVGDHPMVQRGPLPGGEQVAVVHPSQSATGFAGSSPNIPAAQPAKSVAPVNRYAGSLSHSGGPSAMAGSLGMPTAPNLPTAPAQPSATEPSRGAFDPSVALSKASPTVIENQYANKNSTGRTTPATNAAPVVKSATNVVENPHFALTSQSQSDARGSLIHGASQQTATAGDVEFEPALDGYCPVALFTQTQWIEGNPKFAVRHRGQVYLLSSEQAVQVFLANPDDYCPVLAGYDPMIYLTEGRLVPGSVQHGLIESSPVRILLFSSDANKERFRADFNRLYEHLERMVAMARTGK